MNGDKNYFYPCLKDIIQFINGYNPDKSDIELHDDDFFQDSNNVLLVLSDMRFKSVEDFTKEQKYAHAVKDDIDDCFYSSVAMEQVCRSAKLFTFPTFSGH